MRKPRPFDRALRKVFRTMGKVADRFNYIFPNPQTKNMGYYSRNKLRVYQSYIEIADRRWRLISGASYSLTLIAVWLWISFRNFMGFDTFMHGLGSLSGPLYILLFGYNFRLHLIVLFAKRFGTPVLIGDIEDRKAEALMIAMRDAAEARKIKVRFIKQGNEMRAYFRNDEDAVLVRASA